jgi:hypothetical protein
MPAPDAKSPIYVTLGKKRYVWGTIIETTGKDISAATYTVALSPNSTTPPTSGWVAPDVNAPGVNANLSAISPLTGQSINIPTTAQRIVKLLVTPSTGSALQVTTAGNWNLWVNIADSSEVEPWILQSGIITA